MKYTEAFAQIDLYSERQIDAEERIAFEIFSRYQEISIVEMSFHIAQIVENNFGGISGQSVLGIGKIILKIRQALIRWRETLESSYGPNDGECADIGKELLILILSYAHPEYVDKGQEEEEND